MRRQSVELEGRFRLFALALAAGALGCSSPLPPLGDDSGTFDAGGRDADSGNPNGDASSNDAQSDVVASDAGTGDDASFVDIADTPCNVIDAGVVLVAGPAAPRMVTVGAVGTSRFAASEADITTFDQTGGSVVGPFTPTGADLLVASAESSDIAVAQQSGGGVGFSRWSISGSAVLAVQTVQTVAPTGDPALAIASKPSSSLLVWREATNLRALEYTTSAGTPVNFGNATVGTTVDVVAAYDGTSDYGIAWSSDPGDGTYRVRFAKWSATGTVSTFYHQPAPVHVDAIRPLSGGWVVLASAGTPLSVVMVFFLDSTGSLTGKIHRYQGAQYAWDLATSSSGLGLVALRNSGEPEFRSLDTTGAPISGWVCLSASLGTAVGGSGIDSDALGYATAYSTPSGSANFVRLDKSGVPQ